EERADLFGDGVRPRGRHADDGAGPRATRGGEPDQRDDGVRGRAQHGRARGPDRDAQEARARVAGRGRRVPMSGRPPNPDQVKIGPGWALRVPASLAIRRQVLAFAALNGEVYVACANPGDTAALEAVGRFTGRRVVPQPADAESLHRALSRVYTE